MEKKDGERNYNGKIIGEECRKIGHGEKNSVGGWVREIGINSCYLMCYYF